MYTQEEMIAKYMPQVKTAAVAKKFKTIFARPAVDGEIVTTITADGVETQNVANDGDMVAMNNTAAKEKYIIPAKKFPNLYDLIEDDKIYDDGSVYSWEKYAPKGAVHALEVTTENNPGNFIAPWGAEMKCEVGDFLCCPVNGNEVYRIAREEFFETYAF